MANMGHHKCSFGAVLYKSYIIVAGGFNGVHRLDSIEVYDIEEDSWFTSQEKLDRPLSNLGL
jgi:hypothetical protein